MIQFLNYKFSLAMRVLLTAGIGLIGFSSAWYFYHTMGVYFSCISVLTVVSISFFVDFKMAILYAILVSVAGDYFFIPPIGRIFEDVKSFEHFFIVCGASVISGFFVSAIRCSLRRLSVARHEAERISHQMEKMLALVSHDVRNPLTAAKMSAQLVLENPSRSNRQLLLSSVLRNLDRADSLIQTLLDVSSIRIGKSIPLQYRYYDLTADLRDIVTEISLTYENRLAFVASEPTWGLWGRDGIRRALENLVSNALKYGGSDSPVTVSIVHDTPDVLISVHNHGNEIAKSDQGALFDYFRRGDSQGSSLRGWGLGLALVKGIAEAHGGRVRVESGSGLGTKFVLSLPERKKPSVILDHISQG